MKKKTFVSCILALALCVFLLAGCSSRSTISITDSWESSSSYSYNANFSETLEYSLSYESSYDEGEAGWHIYLDEENCSYTVSVETVPYYSAPDGMLHYDVYYMHIETYLSAAYAYLEEDDGEEVTIVSFGGDTGTEADYTITDLWFHSLNTNNNLEDLTSMEPIYSTKTTLSHSPSGYSSDIVYYYYYTTETVYDETCENAVITYTDNWGDLSDDDRLVNDYVYKYSYSAETEAEDIADSYSVFDENELVFAGRGFTYEEDDSDYVSVVSTAGALQTMYIYCDELADVIVGESSSNSLNYFYMYETDSSSGTETVSYISNKSIYSAEVSFSVSGAGYASGSSTTVTYAQEDGYYRVPLIIDMPFSYLLGTLSCSLTSLSHTE